MGTNYYIHSDKCKECGHTDEVYHIGKSSAGWCFSLHVVGAIETLADVMGLARTGHIKDEYGHPISCEEMLQTITGRSSEMQRIPDGYSSWVNFHKQNFSEEGPNGLLRHQIGQNCIGHGAGTWDLISGEFS